MNGYFKLLGLSYKNCPIEWREILAFNEEESRKLLYFIKSNTDCNEVMVVSTCNRTEIYYFSESAIENMIFEGIRFVKKLDSIASFCSYFQQIASHDAAIKHLFRVSMGLEANVIGDIQISSQIKKSYQWSADEEVAGPMLHRLMHSIFFTNKRVVQETNFRDGAASVSYAAAELVDDLASNFVNPKVLILGLGEIGTDVCKNLEESDIDLIYIANRTQSKADKINEGNRFQVIPFDKAQEAIEQADIIISSLSMPAPFITAAYVEKLKIDSYKFFIDLSIPRSIEPAVDHLAHAEVYNIDTIQNKANKAVEARIASIPSVEKIVEEAIFEFENWSKEMVVSPTIQKLKNALEDIRQEEMSRFLKKADASQVKIVEQVTKSMIQKVMKLPVLQLKAACKRGEADTLIDVLNDLFNLEQETEPSKK